MHAAAVILWIIVVIVKAQASKVQIHQLLLFRLAIWLTGIA